MLIILEFARITPSRLISEFSRTHIFGILETKCTLHEDCPVAIGQLQMFVFTNPALVKFELKVHLLVHVLPVFVRFMTWVLIF